MARQGQALGPPMIVVDANILVYRMVEGEKTPQTLRLEEKDSDWRTSALWEYEFGNALAFMARQGHLTQKIAAQLFHSAREAFKPGETPVNADSALHLALDKKISFYDAQYLALAQALEVPLVTEDKALKKAAGKRAVSLQDFLS